MATDTTKNVPLPTLHEILLDLSALQSSNTLVEDDPVKLAHQEKQRSLDKLARFKDSAGKSQRAEGVVENGFEVATDFLQMQKQLSASKKEMDTLQDRMDGLERELTEVRELIAFNPV
ncbi:hypothetical protein DFQ26_005221 [Actinomortierella ambigua]|nr:hypothetical protein DFQ26_005221 [Actinomortierella ambigua]